MTLPSHPDTGFAIGALEIWVRAQYLSVTDVPHNTESFTSKQRRKILFPWNLNARARISQAGSFNHHWKFLDLPAAKPSLQKQTSLTAHFSSTNKKLLLPCIAVTGYTLRHEDWLCDFVPSRVPSIHANKGWSRWYVRVGYDFSSHNQGRIQVEKGKGYRKIKRAQTYNIRGERRRPEAFCANKIPNTPFLCIQGIPNVENNSYYLLI